MTIFATSDIHFGHDNIIKYCNRPYTNIDEMNTALTANWNSVVSQDDVVYIIGDVCMGQLDKSVPWVHRLNGHKILIRGNHDKKACKRADFCSAFDSIHDYFELKDNGDTFIMSHFPFAIWDGAHKGTMHLHGHSHHSYHPGLPTTLDKGKLLDVGIDGKGYDYTPISITQIRKIMAQKSFIATDHHDL